MKPMNYVLDNAGCYNELEFWSTYSGLSKANSSWVDHMVAALGKNGYSGTPGDMYRAWLTDMGGMINAPLNGLTFFKNFTSLGNGGLNATLSVGSGTATYTSTSGTPTMTGGYNATTANADVLKYPIAGNRTAAQETIVIKFQMSWNLSNDGLYYYLTTTDTKAREAFKINTGAQWRWKPNSTDSGSVSASPDASILKDANTTYIITMLCQHTSPYATSFVNGNNRVDYTTDDWTTNNWGTYFYIGCRVDGTSQIEGYIAKVAFFNRALTASEVATVTNLM